MTGQSSRQVLRGHDPSLGGFSLSSLFGISNSATQARADEVLERAAVAENKRVLADYALRYESVKTISDSQKRQSKPDMTAASGMRKDGAALPRMHGRVPGVKEGEVFSGKGRLYVLGIHNSIPSGIGAPTKKEFGAYSVVLSGAYKDDDVGDTIVYTGQCHRHMLWPAANEALRNNITSKTPVRVCRRRPGTAQPMWSYEGLYDVIDYRVVDEVTNGSSREAQGADGADASSSKQSDQQAGDVASTAQGTKKVIKFTLVRNKDNKYTTQLPVKYDPAQSAAHANSRRSSVLKKRKLNQQSPGYSARKVLHQTPCGQPGGAPAGSAPRAPEPSQPNSPEIDRKVMDDVSEGKEGRAIPVYNSVDFRDDLLPEGFQYVKESDTSGNSSSSSRRLIYNAASMDGDKLYVPFSNVFIPPSEAYAATQGSRGLPVTTEKCSRHYINEDLEPDKGVVNKGIQLPLEVFKTRDRGWGLRCPQDIPRGTFVCEYAGEIITSEEANNVNDAYLFELSHFRILLDVLLAEAEELMGSVIDPTARQDILKRCQASQGMLLCVNAERKGNVGRFVNCSRNHYNCVVKPVVTKKHHSTLFYKLCIFTAKDVAANTELTYDYSYDVNSDRCPSWYQQLPDGQATSVARPSP